MPVLYLGNMLGAGDVSMRYVWLLVSKESVGKERTVKDNPVFLPQNLSGQKPGGLQFPWVFAKEWDTTEHDSLK